MFRELIAKNTAEDWFYALLSALVFMLLVKLLQRLLALRLRHVARTSSTTADDFLLAVLGGTRLLPVVIAGLYLGSKFLTLPGTLEKLADRTFAIVLIVQAGLWVSRGLLFWLAHHFSQGEKEDEGARAMTLSLLSFLGQVAIWVVLLLLMLENLGVNVTTLVASLGIGGVAVALALQNILGDLFASLSIAIDKPFVIGDFIVVGDTMGSVEHVGLKTTRVRSLGGEQVVLSNTDLLKGRIHNYKRMQERRVLFAIGVAYGTSPDLLEQIPMLIREAVTAQTGTRFDRAHFKSFGASSLDFEVVYYMLLSDYNLFMDAQQAINLQLVRSLAQLGIAFALPTQKLHIQAAPGTAPG
jgi:small-conductance mechanosensitive channel